MKKKLLLQAEYATIIINLLSAPYNVNSVTKLLFMSFGVKHAVISNYNNRKTDFIKTFFRPLNIKIISHPEEIKSILFIISVLEMNKWITISDDSIVLKKKLPKDFMYNHFLNNLKEKKCNPLIEINKLSKKSFLEEVLQYV